MTEAAEIVNRFDFLNDERIDYTNETVFLIQVGKGARGSYKNHYVITGNLAQAVWYYNCINIGRGAKKRLVMPSTKRTLARATS